MKAKQLLSKIKHPKVRRMALENAGTEFLKTLYTSIARALYYAFVWEATEQGHLFWEYVSYNITEDGELPADMESKFPEIFGNTELQNNWQHLPKS